MAQLEAWFEAPPFAGGNAPAPNIGGTAPSSFFYFVSNPYYDPSDDNNPGYYVIIARTDVPREGYRLEAQQRGHGEAGFVWSALIPGGRDADVRQVTEEEAMSLPDQPMYRTYIYLGYGSVQKYNPFRNMSNHMWFRDNMYMDDREDRLGKIVRDPKQNILQIKGWGSGVQGQDHIDFVGCTPHDPEFVNAVYNAVSHYLPKVPVWIQWDGDALTTDTYGCYLVAVAQILVQRGLLLGLICMKLTTPDKADAFIRHKFMEEKGGDMLVDACPDAHICIVAYTSEKEPDVKAEQKRTKYGFYGACLNNLFAGGKTILAFGGGDVLTQEYNQGYTESTSIVPFDLTRKNGVHSDFVRMIGA